MIKICVDPGHGGSDRANRGSNGYIEADGVLTISRYLKEALESTGEFEVILTRSSDIFIPLTERGRIAARNGCQMFISEHTNAGPIDAGGTTVYYSVDIPGDRELGEKIASAISEALGIRNRGAKTKESTRTPGEDYYAVIDSAQDNGVPHVFLVESAFHSNPEEEALLLDDKNLRKIAEAQARVICEFFGINSDKKVPETPATPAEKTKPAGNENVKALQHLCNTLGIRDMNEKPLVADGIPGPKTRYAVSRLPLCGLKYRQSEATKYIQDRLNKLGFRDDRGNKLVVDGIFGLKTDQAVKKFQRAKGLSVDGIVGPKTWLKLLEV